VNKDNPLIVRNRLHRVLVTFRGRTRLPFGWMHIVGELHYRQAPPDPVLGLQVTIETPSAEEALRLQEAILDHNPKWGKHGEASVEMATAETVTKLSPFDPDLEHSVLLSPLADDHYEFRWERSMGIAITPEMRAQRLQEREARLEAQRQQNELEERQRQQHLADLQAFNEQQQKTFLAAGGDINEFWTWHRTQPAYPGFREWQRAITAGDEIKLLPPAPAVPMLAAPPSPEAVAREEAKRREEEERRIAEEQRQAEARQALERDLVADAQREAERCRANILGHLAESFDQSREDLVRGFCRDWSEEGHAATVTQIGSAVDRLLAEGKVVEKAGLLNLPENAE
jgi:hypothetical protein